MHDKRNKQRLSKCAFFSLPPDSLAPCQLQATAHTVIHSYCG